jgi:threonine synthase
MQDLHHGEEEGSTWNNLKTRISGYAFTDADTEAAVRKVYRQYQYIIDPHGAVGYLALESYQKVHPDSVGVILETAHPAKFKEDVDRILGMDTPVPERLAILADRQKVATAITTEYHDFKNWLEKHLK